MVATCSTTIATASPTKTAETSEPLLSSNPSTMRLTVFDHIARAKSSQDIAELEAAETLAEHEHDWRSIGAAYQDLNDKDGARRCFEQAVIADPVQVWSAADLAALLSDAFADRDGAIQVLDACQKRLKEHKVKTGYSWVQLAGHFRALVSDEARERACLETAERFVSDVSDLCDLARAHGELGLFDKAGTLLSKAEAKFAEDWQGDDPLQKSMFDARSIVNTHRIFGDDKSADEALEGALALADSTSDALILAAGSRFDWDTHDAPDFLRRVFQKAETCARAASNWLDIADNYHELGAPEDNTRGALSRALELAEDEGDDRVKRQVSERRGLWFGEVGSAVFGVAPQSIATHASRHSMGEWEADPAALFDLLRAEITDATIERIASADYGFGFDECKHALQQIRKTGRVPSPLESRLHEVCALTRWSEGERVDHVERAFVCTLLSLDLLADGGFVDDITATLAPLTESCLALGEQHSRALCGLCVWIIESTRAEEAAWLADDDDDDDDDDIFDSENTLAALYALLIAQAHLDPSDARLAALAAHVIDTEARHATFSAHENKPWMARALSTIRDEMWTDLGRRALKRATEAEAAWAVTLREKFA